MHNFIIIYVLAIFSLFIPFSVGQKIQVVEVKIPVVKIVEKKVYLVRTITQIKRVKASSCDPWYNHNTSQFLFFVGYSPSGNVNAEFSGSSMSVSSERNLNIGLGYTYEIIPSFSLGGAVFINNSIMGIASFGF